MYIKKIQFLSDTEDSP